MSYLGESTVNATGGKLCIIHESDQGLTFDQNIKMLTYEHIIDYVHSGHCKGGCDL